MKKLGFGCMRLPVIDPNDVTTIDMPLFEKMVDTFLERGFTYFDTAYVYHSVTSEKAVREALVKRHPRDSFTLATKLPLIKLKEAADMDKYFAEQLENCGVEFFDYFLLHNINSGTWPTVQKLDAFNWLRKQKADGKVVNMGFSFHDSAELLEEILAQNPDMDFVAADQLSRLGECHHSVPPLLRGCHQVRHSGDGDGTHQGRHPGQCLRKGREALQGSRAGAVGGQLGDPLCCQPAQCKGGAERYVQHGSAAGQHRLYG